jgi:hypothetical protein
MAAGRRIGPDRCDQGRSVSEWSSLSRLLRRTDLIERHPWLTTSSFQHLKKSPSPPPFFRLGRLEVIFEDDWEAWLRSRGGRAKGKR